MNLKNKEFLNFFIIGGILFFSALILGILSGERVRKTSALQGIEIYPLSLPQFIFHFALASLFIFLLIRFLKSKKVKGKLYKFLFVLISFFAGMIFFEIWFPEPIPLFLISLLLFWWIKKPSVFNQNLLMIFGIVGISIILGLQMKPEVIVLLLILLSIYDFIAVYKTKHMVKMAQEMIEQRVIFGLIVPSDVFGFKESLAKIAPGGKFLILGGGDVAFPLLFSVSLLSKGIFASLIVVFFALFGLLANFYLLLRQTPRKPIPALPLIASFSIGGYLLFAFLMR